MSPLWEIGLIVAAYLLGRTQQFMRDASSVMGTDRKDK
jgi:hypothetical protein